MKCAGLVGQLLIGMLLCAMLPFVACAADCPAPASGSSVNLPGQPFGMAVTRDGCWMFVSLDDGKQHGSVAVLHNDNGTFAVQRSVPLPNAGSGLALAHDGSLLFVADDVDVAIFDVAKLEQGSADAQVGKFVDGHGAGAVYVATSKDDGLLFVSDEYKKRIVVYDLAKWRAHGFRGTPFVGYVPSAVAPVGLALSPDGKWLYSTSEVAPPEWGFKDSCAPEVPSERTHAQGFVSRIDVAKAAKDPAHSMAGGMQAGCNPVRVAVSPDGQFVWLTARDDGAVLRIASDSFGSRSTVNVTRMRVGASPVGLAVRPDGKQVWVALSNRFAGQKHDAASREVVGLLGTDDPAAASIKMVSEPAAGFPRELLFLPDGRTLAVGLFDAKRVDFFTTPP